MEFLFVVKFPYQCNFVIFTEIFQLKFKIQVARILRNAVVPDPCDDEEI